VTGLAVLPPALAALLSLTHPNPCGSEPARESGVSVTNELADL